LIFLKILVMGREEVWDNGSGWNPQERSERGKGG
jgi:hypothetical protein